MALYPFVFQPIFKERVWGGRTLARVYGKPLPPDVPIGESWEVSDRPGDESVIANGPLAGRTLRWVMSEHRAALLGRATPAVGDRFPILCKILDAREKLSLQVHPPVHASRLGDPKTEMWYIAAAEPGAELYVGLRPGTTRDAFAEAIAAGTVADCFHRIPVRAGDTMFLPSGRVHAIGSGLLIFEIQQNSDTTFRVYDWDRVGLDGRPRDLHIRESMESIDFEDFEPGLQPTRATAPPEAAFVARTHVNAAPLFHAAVIEPRHGGVMPLGEGTLSVVAVTQGQVQLGGGGETLALRAGQFAVVPAATREPRITAGPGVEFLLVEAG